MSDLLLKTKNALFNVINGSRELSEDEFYTRFFVENPDWNKSTPNADELLRWNTIENFLYYIKGHKQLMPSQQQTQILDVGCGRGWLSNLLSTYGRITAIEPVAQVVKHAQQLFPHLDIKCGTTDDLINEGRLSSFDIIVCSEVIEHVPDQDKAYFLLSLKRLLKPKGFLILTTPRKDAQQEWLKYGDATQPVEDWMTEHNLEQLIAQCGLKKHLLERIAMPPVKRAPNIEIYQLWLIQNG